MRRVKADFISLFQPQPFAPIDGMRAITCLMITALHIGQALNTLIPPHPHPQWTRYLHSYSFRLTALFVSSLEIFFMLSGFLLTQKLIQQRFCISLREYPVYVLKRACRLWPGILLGTTMALILGEPKSNWWSVWLFYQNYARLHQWSVGLGTLWSVSLDMQMHALLPLIFAVIVYFRGLTFQNIRSPLYLLVLFSVVHSLLVFDPVKMDVIRLQGYHNSLALVLSPQKYDWITTTYNVTLPFEKLRTESPIASFMERLYFPTISRYSGFIVGAILALNLRDANQITVLRSGTFKKYAYLTVIALGMLLLTVPADPEAINPVVVTIMISITRQLFAIAQAFVLFCTLCPPSHPYHSPWLKSFLSLRIWTPIARLSYLIYVLHFRIAFELVLSQHRFFDPARSAIDRLVLLCLAIVLTICSAISVVWFVLVEKPFERWTNEFLFFF